MVRIDELRSKYREYHNWQPQRFWTPDFINQEIDVHRFRKDSGYVHQSRLGTTDEGYRAFYERLKRRDYLGLISKTLEDGTYGVETIKADDGTLISRDLLDSISEIYFIEETWKIRPGMKILDVGAGYGRLGKRLLDTFPEVDYVAVDAIAESTYVCELYLGTPHTLPFYELDERLGRWVPDLVVNAHSFSEIPLREFDWWLGKLGGVFELFIVPNGGGDFCCVDGQNAVGILEKHGFREFKCQAKIDDPALRRIAPSGCNYYRAYTRHQATLVPRHK